MTTPTSLPIDQAHLGLEPLLLYRKNPQALFFAQQKVKDLRLKVFYSGDCANFGECCTVEITGSASGTNSRELQEGNLFALFSAISVGTLSFGPTNPQSAMRESALDTGNSFLCKANAFT